MRRARRRHCFTLTAALCLGTWGGVLLAEPAPAQSDPSPPLLTEAVDDDPLTLQARYVRRMPLDDGWALMLTGGAQIEFRRRVLTARNAVVWIERDRHATGRPYFTAHVYLFEDAEIVEPGGTVTSDRRLYVSNLRTFAPIELQRDAQAVEDLRRFPLYQQAAAARANYEQAETRTLEPEAPSTIVKSDELDQVDRGPASIIRYRVENVEPATTDQGQRLLVSTGGVYFSRSGGPDAAFLEIQADRAVMFLGRTAADAENTAEPSETSAAPPEEPTNAAPPNPQAAPPEPTAEPDTAPDDNEDAATAATPGFALNQQTQGAISGVYLEGDVRLALGNRFVRAARLYYDFEREQALIIDTVFRADMPDRGVPLYIRAAEFRQLAPDHFSAVDAQVTTSEFFTPHYHIGVSEIDIWDRTPRGPQGDAAGAVAGEYELHDLTFNIANVPLTYWPYAKGTFDTSETLLRRLSAGFESEFGATLETEWYLYSLLGATPPAGYDATLILDYFTDRGPAVGIDADYQRQNYFGLLRSYYINDGGEDDLGPLRQEANDFGNANRGRFLWRHKHFLENDWQAQFELSYLSDPNFLETYEPDEFYEDKEQETLIYLKRVRDNEVISLLLNWRINDWLTQTEHLPELTYWRIGDTLLDPVIFYTESRFGAVRRRVDNRQLFEYRRFSNQGASDITARGDLRQEFELPLKLGAFNLVPFATFRGTYWDGQPLADGGLWRGFGLYGLRGSTSLSRVFPDVQSELFAIDGIRHIIHPDFAAWWAHSNTRSERITPFDYAVESIDDFYGAVFGLRQTWQTKRGAGVNRHTVDLVTVDLETGLFGDVPGEVSDGYAFALWPEYSRPRNYVGGEVTYRLSDTSSLLYDFNIDINDGEYDRHNIAVAVERDPRLAYLVGFRSAGDIDFNLVGGGFNYRISEKHTLATRVWYDVEESKLGELVFTYVRKLPRWYVAFSFEVDEVFDDISVNLSAWPEGIPEWSVGSRDYTGLSTSTGIRP